MRVWDRFTNVVEDRVDLAYEGHAWRPALAGESANRFLQRQQRCAKHCRLWVHRCALLYLNRTFIVPSILHGQLKVGNGRGRSGPIPTTTPCDHRMED